MNFEKNDSYFIQADELELLLAGAGIKTWYGIPVDESSEEEARKTGNAQVYAVLAGLYQKNYISWDLEDIKVLEPVLSLVRIIRDAGECLELDYEKDNIPTLMAYVQDDRCALLEESPWDKNVYRFGIWNKADLDDFINDQSLQLKAVKKRKLLHGDIQPQI